MIVIGLTGNYGMGKSTVANMFRRLGALILDSDVIVAELLETEAVRSEVMGLLGVGVIGTDGRIDKKAVAGMVFRSPALRRKLEDILHPLVFAVVEDVLGRIRPRDAIVIVEVPLLFEGGYEQWFDRTILVFTDRKTAVQRLAAAGISAAEAKRRWKAQLDVRTKKRLADMVVDNSGTKRQTEARVRDILRTVRNEPPSLSRDRRRSGSLRRQQPRTS